MHITPEQLLLIHPLINITVADIDTADKSRMAIYDNDLAVIAVIDAVREWDKKDFVKDFEENPKKWAPWVPGGIRILKEKGIL